uniref:Uncharacterized protein n=1 Tax=Sinocyclocheilus rhinocerous TaxID=307959 RepID=A0A673MLP9_9TELE
LLLALHQPAVICMTTKYLDSSAPTFAHSIWYSSTRRINHGHKANEVLSWEVHFFRIKCKTLRKLVIREAKVAETFKKRTLH